MAELWQPNYTDVIVMDIETHDQELGALGPGVYHDPDARVLGCGIWDSKTKVKKYYPLHHTDCSSEELARSRCELAEILAPAYPV